MAQNIFEIQYLNPVRFYPESLTPGGHFDDDWLCRQILSFERNVSYYQKWQLDDTIKLQVQSSIGGVQAKINDKYGTTHKTVNFTDVTPGGGQIYTNYEASITLNDLSPGVYFLIVEAIFMSIVFRAISEPFDLRAKHHNTSVYKYKNSINDFGIVFSTGIEFTFRCESAIVEPEGDRERTSYRDQILNQTTLSATPFNKYKLYVGEAPGVAPWVQTLLNRIFCCDNVFIDNLSKGKYLKYETPEGAKWEVSRVKSYPLIGATIDLVEAQNRSGLQLTSEEVPEGGIFISYDIETDAFGTLTNPSSQNPVQIETIEQA